MLGKLTLAFALLFAANAFAADEASTAPSQWKVATGLALESRLDSEVNPGFSDLREIGQFFELVRRHPWGASAEVGYESQSSSSGALQISTRTVTAALWGRYAFLDPNGYSPYVALGVGMGFDSINSSFEGQSDSRRGTRLMGGLGVGLSKTFWKYLLTEAEVRGSMVEDRARPSVSFLMRAGFELF